MSQETLDHVVMGALYEFCGELLAREEPITFSRRHSARPVVAVLREFMKKKGLDPAVTPMTGTWQHRCSGLHLKDADGAPVDEGQKNVAERRAVEGSEPHFLDQMATACGGKIENVSGELPDGSGCMTMSLPLPKDHWLTAEGENIPPKPCLHLPGYTDHFVRLLRAQVRAAGRYAVRSATANGKTTDFDPDALVQALEVGMLGSGESLKVGEEKS